MIDLCEMSDEELTNLMFSDIDKNSENIIESKRRIELAQTDLTYKDYPVINIMTGKFQGYPFEGWSKEEINEYLKEKNIYFKTTLIKD